MELFAISLENLDFREMRNAEHIFQGTFADKNCFSEENNPRCALQKASISLPNNCVLNTVGCFSGPTKT